MSGRPVAVQFLRENRKSRHQLSAAGSAAVDLGTVQARRIDMSDGDKTVAGIEFGRALVKFRVRDEAVTQSVRVGDVAATGDGDFDVIGKTEMAGARRGFEIMAERRSDV
jgi:hypothetical protein